MAETTEFKQYELPIPIFDDYDPSAVVQAALGSQRQTVVQEAESFDSGNYVPNTAGWSLKANGDLEANAGSFRGAIKAASIDIPNTSTANSFHVDTDGNAWWGASVIASAIAKVLKTGAATFTSIVATGTINAIGGYLGAPTTVLNITTSGLDIGVTGHLQGGQTDFNTGVGFFLGYSGTAYKFSIGDPSGDYFTWDGATISTNKFVLTGIGAFGGNGSDGTLSVSSGTTTIDLGGAAYVVKNYKSISITGTGSITFANPHASGTVIVLKSQGNVTITSSATRAIDARGFGASGSPNGLVFATNSPAGASSASEGAASPGGVAGAQFDNPSFYTFSSIAIARRYMALVPGAGGGAGQGGTVAPFSVNGGNGGAALLIECAGALNFTGTIDVSGAAGSNGLDSSTGRSCSAGGGGSAGMCIVLYNTLTANTGAITAAGGNGGNGGTSTSSTATGSRFGGGGGAGSLQGRGGVGETFNLTDVGNGSTGAGGGGGSGTSNAAAKAGGSGGGSMGGLVAQNTVFA